jgi:hypothetical protein
MMIRFRNLLSNSTCAATFWQNKSGTVNLYLGRAVQVDPMNATLKEPGTKRLKLTQEELIQALLSDST